MRLRALIRGKATVADLSKALDGLGVKDGEHFILAGEDVFNPTKPGYCSCGRPLQEALFDPSTGQKPGEALLQGDA